MSDANASYGPSACNGHNRNGTSFPRRGGHHGNGLFAARPAGSRKRPDEEDEIDLVYLLTVLWQHKWLIVAVTALMTLLAGVYAFTRSPVYQSEGTMLIKQSRNQYSVAGSDLRGLLSSSYGLGVGSTIANELQVLGSRKLAGEIARRLHRERFTENGRLYPSLWLSYPEDSTLAPPDQAALQIRSGLDVSQVGETDQMGLGTDVIRVAYKSPSAHEARRVVDLAMTVYSDLSTRKTREAASSALVFLEKEKRHLRDRLSRAEDSLESFMQRHKLVQVEAQSLELIRSLSDLENRRQQVRASRAAVGTGIDGYRQELNRIRPGLAEQFSEAVGPKMQRFQYELAELETEKLLLLAGNPHLKDTPDIPELTRLDRRIKMVRGEIGKLRSRVMRRGDSFAVALDGRGGSVGGRISELNRNLLELQIEAGQYDAQAEVINEQAEALNSQFEFLPQHMVEYNRWVREVMVSEDLFLTISRQTSETALWEQTRVGNGITLDSGYLPLYPVDPGTKLYILVGFVAGGLLSVGMVFLKETLNTRIDGVEKLKSYDYPVLGVIPDMTVILRRQFGERNKVSVNEHQVSTTLISLLDAISTPAEAFRRLSNNLFYSNPDIRYKTLIITSPGKGEGKTNVSGNLAVTLAQSGKRVLLMDMDFRQPSLHRLFGLADATKGLCEVLYENLDLKEAIKSTPAEGVDLLPCGRHARCSAAISNSRKLAGLIGALQQNKAYDHILIDTAPYGIISDAGPLIGLADGVILTARFGGTFQAQLEHTMEDLRRISAPVAGSVLTAYDQARSSDSHYWKGYYRYASKQYNQYLAPQT